MQHELAAALLLKTADAAVQFPASQADVLYGMVYELLPAQRLELAYGDVNVQPAETFDERKRVCAALAAALYPAAELAPVLNGLLADAPWQGMGPVLWLLCFLAAPATPAPVQPLASLPLAHYFPAPMGELVVRTGWAANDSVVALRLGGWFFGNHQRRDVGSLQVFSGAAQQFLVGSSGQYDGYETDHWINYLHSTISVSSLLIFDPDEQPENKEGLAGINVGGQRLPRWSQPRNLGVLLDPAYGYHMADVLAWSVNTSASYADLPPLQAFVLEGNLTRAYAAAKAQAVLRSYTVWLGPAAEPVVLVLDHVDTRRQFAATFVLHTMIQPNVSQDGATFEAGPHLVGWMLQPAEPAAVRVVPGYEAGGHLWPPQSETGLSAPWRLEWTRAATDPAPFVVVLYAGAAADVRVRLLPTSKEMIALQVNWAVRVFAADPSQRLQRIRLTDISHLDWYKGRGLYVHACNLVPGRWCASGGEQTDCWLVGPPDHCLAAFVLRNTTDLNVDK